MSETREPASSVGRRGLGAGLVVGMAAIAATLLVVSIGPLPYGFYLFLRVETTIVAIALIVDVCLTQRYGWLAGIIPVAVLWNPILPVGLPRTAWLPLDLLAAAFLVVLLVFRLRNAPADKGVAA